MKFLLNQFINDAKVYGPRKAFGTLIWNARFELGYKIGGFTSARRSKR